MCAPILGCSGAGSLREFPRETTVELVSQIDPNGFGAPFAGGRIVDIAAGPDGSLLLAAIQPGQVIDLSPEGRVVWAKDGSETRVGQFQGPGLILSRARDAFYLVDSGTGRVHRFGADGTLQEEVALSVALDAAASPGGELFVFPNTTGFLLDVFDAQSRYLRSIVPLPGEPVDLSFLGCLLLPDPDGGVFALWNPSRTIYRLGPEGERKAEFKVDPPDLVSNLEERLRRVHERAAQAGLVGTINPFLDLTTDEEGRLAALYLFERFESEVSSTEETQPTRDAAVYRFTTGGRAVDVIRGFGNITRVVFMGGEVYGLDREANRILRFRFR